MSLQTTYFPMVGGLNTEAPPLATNAGELIDCVNYEALINGGYRRIDGYVLFDGQATAAQAVPGTGDVLGVHVYKNTVYAIREDGTNGRLYKATVAGWVEVDNTFTWSLGGTYYFANYNFYGQDAQEEMFIVNGVDKCVKFDGTTLTQITTGTGSDNPSFVIGHKKHLFLAIESSLVNSAIGNPTDYQAINGAGEIAVGDTISQMVSASSALVIGCEDSTHVLYGSSEADFQLDQFNSSGTYRGTMAQIGGMVLGLDHQGVMSMTTAQQFGNFAYSSLSSKIATLVKNTFGATSRSSIRRTANQYRLFKGNYGLYFSFRGADLIGVTPVKFLHTVTCMAQGLDANKNEITFFGSDDGKVYQMDTGYDFNGQAIYAYLITSFHHFGGPTTNKRFRLVQPDLRIEGDPMSMNVSATSNYGGGVSSTGAKSGMLQSGLGPWDFSDWDAFYYDLTYHTDVKIRVSLTGTNMAVMISTDGSTASSQTIYGVTVHYSPRRLIK